MSTQPIPYFGRAWQVSIQTQASGRFSISSAVGKGEEALKVSFRIDTIMGMSYWQAEVHIYNLSPQTAAAITGPGSNGQPANTTLWQFAQALQSGDLVTISAGYEASFNPSANQLFEGHLIQAAWMRENVTDYVLVLRCIVGLMENTINFTSNSLPKNCTAFDMITLIAKDAKFAVDIDAGATAALKQTKFPRAKAWHDKPYNLIRQTCKQYGVFPWVSEKGLTIRKFDPTDPTGKNAVQIPPKFMYGPVNLKLPQGTSVNVPIRQTLVGVPQQTEDGVMFKVLMDSEPLIGSTVQLAPGTLLNFFPVQPGNTRMPVPNTSGIYLVTGIRHVGDTRGNEWETEIIGITPNWFAGFLSGTQPTGGAKVG